MIQLFRRVTYHTCVPVLSSIIARLSNPCLLVMKSFDKMELDTSFVQHLHLVVYFYSIWLSRLYKNSLTGLSVNNPWTHVVVSFIYCQIRLEGAVKATLVGIYLNRYISKLFWYCFDMVKYELVGEFNGIGLGCYLHLN